MVLSNEVSQQVPNKLIDSLRNSFVQDCTEVFRIYPKYAPQDRVALLNYNYVAHRLIQRYAFINKCDNQDISAYLKLIKRFPMVKDKSSVRQHNEIWKKICEELNWICILKPLDS